MSLDARVRRSLLAMLVLAALTPLACVCAREKNSNDKGDQGDGGVGGGGIDPVVELAKGFTLDKGLATADMAEIAKAPHPLGSARQAQVIDWLETRVTGMGLKAAREAFTATVPNPAALEQSGGPVADTIEKKGVNLYAHGSFSAGAAPCVVALASHSDTKVVPNVDYLGANDSGSSSIVLLQQLAYVKAKGQDLGLVCEIVGIWFDGEEAVLYNWTDGEKLHPAKIVDHLYGSRHAAARLTACTGEAYGAGSAPALCLPKDLLGAGDGRPLVALILMDMIGSPELVLSRDANSTAALVELAASGAAALGFETRYAAFPKPIEDDHLPYLERGVPALDLIDFHHLDVWHRDGDEPAAISQESLEIAGKIALYVALKAAREPKVFPAKADP